MCGCVCVYAAYVLCATHKIMLVALTLIESEVVQPVVHLPVKVHDSQESIYAYVLFLFT